MGRKKKVMRTPKAARRAARKRRSGVSERRKKEFTYRGLTVVNSFLRRSDTPERRLRAARRAAFGVRITFFFRPIQITRFSCLGRVPCGLGRYDRPSDPEALFEQRCSDRVRPGGFHRRVGDRLDSLRHH